MTDTKQKIVANLWFDHNAPEAVDFYMSVFKEGKIIKTSYYPTEGLADFQKEFAGKVLSINFEINGQMFIAINAGSEFKFNPSVSFAVNCKDQAEIDYFWDKLTKDGGEESVCGWLTDKYGLSWQVVPENIDELMINSDGTSNPKTFKALMEMKKLIISDLEKARGGDK